MAHDEGENRAVIEAVCALFPDAWVLKIAKWVKMKPGGHAAQHLDHYLSEKGDLAVDLKLLLKEDSKLKKYIVATIEEAIGNDVKRGSFPVHPGHYGNKDWYRALGQININWERTTKGAKISFNNMYRWHPNENRITQCVHQAANNLKLDKKTGRNVGEYRMIGKSIEIELKHEEPQANNAARGSENRE